MSDDDDKLFVKELKDFFGGNISSLLNVDLSIDKPDFIDYVFTNPDGNCGYHGIIQGLVETYVVNLKVGGSINVNLRDFIENSNNIDGNYKYKFNKDEIINIAYNNNKRSHIKFPSNIINRFKQFLLNVEGTKTRYPVNVKEIFDEKHAENPHLNIKSNDFKTIITSKPYCDETGEVVTVKYFRTDEDIIKTMTHQSESPNVWKNDYRKSIIEREILEYRTLIQCIRGGIKKGSTVISNEFWINEFIINIIVEIFDLSLISYKTINDGNFLQTISQTGQRNKEFSLYSHIVFIKTDGGHFEYVRVILKNFDNTHTYNHRITSCFENPNEVEDNSPEISRQINQIKQKENIEQSSNLTINDFYISNDRIKKNYTQKFNQSKNTELLALELQQLGYGLTPLGKLKYEKIYESKKTQTQTIEPIVFVESDFTRDVDIPELNTNEQKINFLLDKDDKLSRNGQLKLMRLISSLQKASAKLAAPALPEPAEQVAQEPQMIPLPPNSFKQGGNFKVMPHRKRRSFGPFQEKTLVVDDLGRRSIDYICHQGGYTQAYESNLDSDNNNIMSKIPAVILIFIIQNKYEDSDTDEYVGEQLKGAFPICMNPDDVTAMNVIVERYEFNKEKNIYPVKKFSLYYPDNAKLYGEYGNKWPLLHGFAFRTAIFDAKKGGINAARSALKGSDLSSLGITTNANSDYEDTMYWKSDEQFNEDKQIQKIKYSLQEMKNKILSVLSLSYNPILSAQNKTCAEEEFEIFENIYKAEKQKQAKLAQEQAESAQKQAESAAQELQATKKSSSIPPTPAVKQEPPPEKSITVQIRIDNKDIPTDDQEVETLKTTIKTELATLLGINNERIIITKLGKGSVVVDFYIRPPQGSDDSSFNRPLKPNEVRELLPESSVSIIDSSFTITETPTLILPKERFLDDLIEIINTNKKEEIDEIKKRILSKIEEIKKDDFITPDIFLQDNSDRQLTPIQIIIKQRTLVNKLIGNPLPDLKKYDNLISIKYCNYNLNCYIEDSNDLIIKKKDIQKIKDDYREGSFSEITIQNNLSIETSKEIKVIDSDSDSGIDEDIDETFIYSKKNESIDIFYNLIYRGGGKNYILKNKNEKINIREDKKFYFCIDESGLPKGTLSSNPIQIKDEDINIFSTQLKKNNYTIERLKIFTKTVIYIKFINLEDIQFKIEELILSNNFKMIIYITDDKTIEKDITIFKKASLSDIYEMREIKGIEPHAQLSKFLTFKSYKYQNFKLNKNLIECSEETSENSSNNFSINFK